MSKSRVTATNLNSSRKTANQNTIKRDNLKEIHRVNKSTSHQPLLFQRKYNLDVPDHKLDTTQFNLYTEEIKNVLTGKLILNLNHTEDGAKWTQSISRILDIRKQSEYHRRSNTFKRQLHWGQLKLFLSEVEFLNKVINLKKKHDALDNNNTDSKTNSIKDNLNKTGDNTDDLVHTRQIIMVYAGAAPGHHTAYLQSLFPEIKFDLYDPNDFVIKNTKMISIHQQFFTDVDAEYWRDYAQKTNAYLVFVSDIRTEPATQENIIRNMSMQLKWWQIMQPELSMFKFRLPWEEGKTEYPFGQIYVQAFPGATSTETRLIVKKNAKLVEYDNKQYENACFYHNTVTREMNYMTKLGKLNLERDGLDNCYDCISFINIMLEYTTVRNIKICELRNLITEVQHEISFGRNSIKTLSIKWFNSGFDKFKKMSYFGCADDRCERCQNDIKEVDVCARGISIATIENEEKAIDAAKKTN